MAVIRALGHIHFFLYIGERVTDYTKTRRSLRLVLVVLTFFSSMLITNDVALLTFVPFTLTLLHRIGAEEEIIPLLVWETTAANLGSMLTPIGNPQNLYLYQKSGMGLGKFLYLMLPFTALSLLLLGALTLWKKDKAIEKGRQDEVAIASYWRAWAYGLLFLLCVLVVAHVLPQWETLLTVTIALVLLDKKAIAEVDYLLLLTFTFLFIFIGNLSAISAVQTALASFVTGREIWTSILLSQLISNVPAAMLLSGFTSDIPKLIIGTNIGGLGTLIASMASLISYRFYGKTLKADKRQYLLLFTAVNLGLLILFSLGLWLWESMEWLLTWG